MLDHCLFQTLCEWQGWFRRVGQQEIQVMQWPTRNTHLLGKCPLPSSLDHHHVTSISPDYRPMACHSLFRTSGLAWGVSATLSPHTLLHSQCSSLSHPRPLILCATGVQLHVSSHYSYNHTMFDPSHRGPLLIGQFIFFSSQ